MNTTQVKKQNKQQQQKQKQHTQKERILRSSLVLPGLNGVPPPSSTPFYPSLIKLVASRFATTARFVTMWSHILSPFRQQRYNLF